MTLSYARYLYPADDQRPRAGTVGKRLVRALVDAKLVAGQPRYSPNAIRLTPSGPLAAFCEAAGLFNPSLQVAIYGAARTFTSPFATDERQTRSFCPECDTTVPTKGHLEVHPQTGVRRYTPIKACTECGMPFDAESWPQTAEPVAFVARLTVAIVADGYEDAYPSFGSHVPGLIRTVESVLDEPMVETIIAHTGNDARRPFASTVPGKHPARPVPERGGARAAWASQAHIVNHYSAA